MGFLPLSVMRTSFRVTSPSARRVGGFSLCCVKETTAFTSRNAEGIPYSRCNGTYSR